MGDGVNRALHEDRVARYLAALKPGVLGIDVAASLGVRLPTVHNSARVIGKLLPRPKSKGMLRYERMAAYYAEHTHLNQSDVARHFGVSSQVMHCALRATGTPSRGRRRP